jgi:hypothetical protein
MDFGERGEAGKGWPSYANELWMKKEEFPGFMKTCCLGTPFPRSALFLETIMWISGYIRKST